jgi:CelD/BcsL family acetyltransferase involved in cellulose biosynthesis
VTDIGRPPFRFRLPVRSQSINSELSVVTLSHAARFLHESPPSADIIILESADALTPYLAELEALSAASADTNSQFEAYSLTAAMEHLKGGSKVRVALVWTDAGEGGSRQLIGAFPYLASFGFFGLPLPVWRVWYHIHSYICTPLLRAGHERHALRHFLALADMRGVASVEFPMFDAGSAFEAALEEVTARQARFVAETDRHERAFISSDLTEEEYLATHIRKKKRKEFNRLWNRLSELGELSFSVDDGSDVEGWLKRFLALEAAGWKGKRGTALKVDPDQRAYFEKICRGAQRQGKLHCTELSLDGKALAMLTSFRAGRGLYTFKIAFDEEYARYSPGVLLMLKLIGVVQGDERIDWADSCAVPDHPMIDHIWAERRAMRSVLVAGSGLLGRPATRYLTFAIKSEALLRAKLRTYYHAFRKEMENDKAD